MFKLGVRNKFETDEKLGNSNLKSLLRIHDKLPNGHITKTQYYQKDILPERHITERTYY